MNKNNILQKLMNAFDDNIEKKEKNTNNNNINEQHQQELSKKKKRETMNFSLEQQ